MTSIATLITTMNRPGELFTGLSALVQCSPGPDEIIVSDDSPAGDRRSEELCKQFPEVRYQVGPRRGHTANRNSCISASNSHWLHFVDDDVVVPADFFARVHDALQRANERTIVTGSEFNHHVPGFNSVVRVNPPVSGFWAHLEPAGARPPNCVVINAAVFPKTLFESVAFDERLRYGSDEADISFHALALGYEIVFDPGVVVSHFPSAANRDVYSSWFIASAIYAGLKRHWVYRKSRALTAGFILLALPRLWMNNIRRNGFFVIPQLCRQTVHGFKYFKDYLQTQSDRIPPRPDLS